MCGIVGYIGSKDPSSVLISGLKRLEYRGYDSAGLALQNGTGIEVRKIAGHVENLEGLLRESPVKASSGIGHTRWATHGPPTTENAHPHVNRSGSIALVHNGIIENASSLRTRLERSGYTFRTPTDTEVLAHLVDFCEGETLEDKVLEALQLVQGTYGLAVISTAEPDKIVVARQGSPVLLGLGEDREFFVASDPSAVLEHTRSVLYLEDGDMAVFYRHGYEIKDLNGRARRRPTSSIDWDLEAIELGGYPHFMLKEIFEQPESMTNTIRGRLLFDEGTARLDGLRMDEEARRSIKRVVIVGCGTSWHAGLVGRHILETMARIPVQVEYASEFRYQTQLDLSDALVVAISQSGETADTLEALRAARASGARVVGLVNVVGSTIAREADGGIYLHAGPEIGVASTKAFTSQLCALLLLGLYLGRARGMTIEEGKEMASAIGALPTAVDSTLALSDWVRQIAKEFMDAEHFLYLGRGANFPVALEGALKLKEVSYIHAEGYPAAELKHGPIALIDRDMPVVVVAPKDHVYTKVLSNLEEVKARGARTIVIGSQGNGALSGLADYKLDVPAVPPLLSPLVTSIPLQLLAYHIAVLRECNVDRPRNLAKSVTVE
jgi:glucosamine--fructose-6-phosphate aminotransferase (isomerizing)